MPTAPWRSTTAWTTVGELIAALGGVSPDRVRLVPPPGRATEKQMLWLNDRKENALYELIDGTIVAKAAGYVQSSVAVRLGARLVGFADDLGVVVGGSGPFRLRPGLVRLPAIGYNGFDTLPSRFIPDVEIADFAPELAADILCDGNTPGEVRRRVGDYFAAGTRLYWSIDIWECTAEVYTAPDTFVALTESDALDGGDVLPSFCLPLETLFARLAKRPRKMNGRKP